MSQTALVLTAEAAEEAGLTGGGPFTFGGAFPGVWDVDAPLQVGELGFADDDEAVARAEELGLPLKVVSVGDGEALAERENHVPSGKQAAQAEKAEVVQEATGGSSAIRTHAQADKIGEELGISFAEGATVAQKVEAIESFNAAAALDADTPPKDNDESVADAQHDAAHDPPAEDE